MIPKKTEEVINEIRELSKNTEGWEFQEELIEYGKNLEEFPSKKMTDENRVSGCVSTVYVYGELVDGKIKFYGYSDSQIVRGLIYILIKMLNGLSPDEILNLPDDILDIISLNEVSPSRVNGFHAAYMQMQAIALKLSQQS